MAIKFDATINLTTVITICGAILASITWGASVEKNIHIQDEKLKGHIDLFDQHRKTTENIMKQLASDARYLARKEGKVR